MEISIKAITPETSNDLERGAASSLFWQLEHYDPIQYDLLQDPEFDKQLWIHKVLMEWGICGYTAFVSTGDNNSQPIPAATIFFAPPRYAPGNHFLPTGPVSQDAILITGVHVALPYMGLYLEHQLLSVVVDEARRRGIKALEAFARVEDLDEQLTSTLLDKHMGIINEEIGAYIPESYRGWDKREAEPQDGNVAEAQEVAHVEAQLANIPMLSEDILEDQGFSVIAHHYMFPRYRKNIESPSSVFGTSIDAAHEMKNGNSPLGTVTGGGKFSD